MTQEMALAVPERWQRTVEQYQKDRYNVLVPRQLIEIPPYHTPAMVIIEVNPDERAGEVYPVGGGKFGMQKPVLDKIAQAAGITWVPEHCRRTDDGSNDRKCRYKRVGMVKDLTGAWRTVIGEKEVDLDAIEAELRESIPKREWIAKIENTAKRAAAIEDAVTKEMIQFRKHMVARAESGAANRAIRSALGLKSAYTKEELSRPFVVPRLQFTPDYNDPDVKRILLAAATGTIAELYAAQASAAVAEIPTTLAKPLPAVPEGDESPAPPPADPPTEPAAVAATTAALPPADTPGAQPGLPMAVEAREPDPDEMRFDTAYESEQAAGTAEVKQGAIDAQLGVLGALMARKGYDPRSLKRPLGQFTRQERRGFATMLLKRPDATGTAKEPWEG